MQHNITELEAPLPLLVALCDRAQLDPRQRALVLTGKRSLQISNTVAVSLVGSAEKYDGRFGVSDAKTQGPRDLGDAVADALERDYRMSPETATARPASGARDMGDLVADRLEHGGV